MAGAELIDGVLLVAGATLAFVVAFAVHVIAWRAAAAPPSGAALILTFVAAIAIESFLAFLAAQRGMLPLSSSAILAMAVLALQVSACYVISYPAMQAESPSLLMARQLSSAGPDGLTPAQLYGRLREVSLVSERIDDLLRDGLAVERGGKLFCTSKGALLARSFALWKALLGESKGG